ncbi:hypothetical protein CXK91_21125 [Stutzerimonas stutzeri]|uniref:Uncharacterized protein n=1 Tax=Stutzerimonas stutzeri TaxID=316 RepID=A0A2S4AI23_STUST|nr:hypothetical protein CXK91_21125 [Stutzerimonas stutzeri]
MACFLLVCRSPEAAVVPAIMGITLSFNRFIRPCSALRQWLVVTDDDGEGVWAVIMAACCRVAVQARRAVELLQLFCQRLAGICERLVIEKTPC